MNPEVDAFFDSGTHTVTYVVKESDGPHCTIVDSVLDYEPKSGRISTQSSDRVIEYVSTYELKLDWILETHAMPTLLFPSVQVNIRAGQLPPPEENGVSYLKIPIR